MKDMSNKIFDKDGVRADVAIAIIVICFVLATIGAAILGVVTGK